MTASADRFRGAVVSPSAASRRQRGAALLLTLFLVALIGILLSVAGRVWRTDTRRAKEAELLVVGQEFVRALNRYRDASPAGTGEYPQRLEQLLLDRRQPGTARYLRRVYRDPLTGSNEWGLVRNGAGGIVGVYSLAPGEPLKQGGFPPAQLDFTSAKRYADWRFMAEVAAPSGGNVPATGVGSKP